MSAVLLAAAGDKPSTGPIGLFLIVVLVVVTILLVRNMNARLRRMRDTFPEPMDPDDPRHDAPGTGQGPEEDRP